jgi:hypothetical protein
MVPNNHFNRGCDPVYIQFCVCDKLTITNSLFHQSLDLEMDKETLLPFTGSDDSEQFHPAVFL